MIRAFIAFPGLGGGDGLQWRQLEASDTFQSPLGSAQKLQRLLSPGAAPTASVLVPTLRSLWNLHGVLFHVYMTSAGQGHWGVEGGEGMRTPCSLKSDGHAVGGGEGREPSLGIAHPIRRERLGFWFPDLTGS